MVSLPTKAPFGVKVAVLVLPELLTLRFEPLAATELICQVNESVSPFTSAPVAAKVCEPLTLIIVPAAAGVCDAHVGGVFLYTVHVFDVVLRPLLTVATKVLLPVLKLDDKSVCELEVPPTFEPFNVHVATHEGSLVVTEN